MTSNSRAKRFASRTLARAMVLVTALAGVSGAWGADAPAPALRPPAGPADRKATKPAPVIQRVKIANVSVRAMALTDHLITTLIADSERSALRDPVVISVQVVDAFTDLDRTASPVIVVDGQTIGDSFVPFKERHRVVAIVRDGTRLSPTVRIQVGWLGDFQRTLSEPVQAQLVR